jgi:predicted GNAT superfamily acetyltransferase
MTDENMTIRRAVPTDLEGILELQAANQRDLGGRLSASLPSSTILEMIRSMPVIVAVSGSDLLGFLMMSKQEMNQDIPIIRAMLTAFPIDKDTLVYGPICIRSELRGQGLAHGLFNELGRIKPQLKCVCFIRRDNPSSIRAHLKIGMQEVGGFIFNQTDHVIFSYTV